MSQALGKEGELLPEGWLLLFQDLPEVRIFVGRNSKRAIHDITHAIHAIYGTIRAYIYQSMNGSSS